MPSHSSIYGVHRQRWRKPARRRPPADRRRQVIALGQASEKNIVRGLQTDYKLEDFLFRTIHDDGSLVQPNGFTDAQDGARYGVIYTNYRDRSHVAALKSANPRLRVYCYFDCTYSDSGDTAGDNSGVGYTDADTNHPTWFLLDGSSQRILHQSSTTAWLMDVGLQAYQDACVTNILSHLSGTQWDGVFLDEVDVRSDWSAAATPALYPTETDWQTAYGSFLANVAAQIQAAGYKVIINLGDDYNSTPSYAVSERWLDYVDGHLQESWTDGGSGLAQQLAWTPERITIVQYADDNGKISLLHSHNTTESGQTYALALGIALGEGNTFLDVAWPTYQDEAILPEFNQAARLGAPTGHYTNPQSGVYRRNFEHGVVLANTTNADSSSISLGGTFSGSGLGGTSSLVVPALTGYVLVEPLTQVIGQASESNSANALSHSKRGTLNQALETDTANADRAVHRSAITQPVETDTAQALTHSKRNTLGQVTETDTAQHDTAVHRATSSQPSETDTAGVFTPVKGAHIIGQTVETDTAQQIKPVHTRVLNQVLESDSAATTKPLHRAQLNQTVETDTAQHFTGVNPLAQPVETDTANALTHAKRGTLNQVVETDSAQAFTAVRGAHVIGQTTEADSAQQLKPQKRASLLQTLSTELAQAFRAVKTRLSGKATETDTAQPFTHAKVGHANTATTTDTAQTLQARKRAALGQVVETDSAQVITGHTTHGLGQVVETDTARPFTGRKTRAITQPSTTDTAQAFRAIKLVSLGRATDTSSAGTTKAVKTRILNQVSTTDVAQTFTHSKRLQLGKALETSVANTLTRRFPVVYPPPSDGRKSAEPVGSGGTLSGGPHGRTKAKVVR